MHFEEQNPRDPLDRSSASYEPEYSDSDPDLAGPHRPYDTAHDNNAVSGHRNDHATEPLESKRKAGNNFFDVLQGRALNSRNVRRRTLREQVFETLPQRVPIGLSERPWKLDGEVNKLFASAWLDHNTVIAGSKNNKLLLFHLSSNKPHEIKLVGNDEAPDACGIHCIALNESRSLLATGGRNVNDCCVYKLPELEPVALLKGHTDWLFGCAWLDDSTLVTGSRDKTLKLWSCRAREDRDDRDDTSSFQIVLHDVGAFKVAHTDKVRAVSSCASLDAFASLSVDGKLVLWDSHRASIVRTVPLAEDARRNGHAVDEVVAMDFGATTVESRDGGTFIAVGSKKVVSLLDSRMRTCAHSIGWLDADGVRSVSLIGNLLTVGGVSGKLAFYDLRAMDFITLHNGDRFKTTNLRNGFVRAEMMAQNTDYLRHAICTHSYDPSGTKLFIGGGPVVTKIFGSYAAVFE